MGEEADDETIKMALLSAAAEQRALAAGPGVPNSYQEAIRAPDARRWREAIQEEVQALLEHNTWEVVDAPPAGTNIAGTRWVFARKSDGRYKARLVVKGFTQRYGVDYFETYAGVVRSDTIRACMAIAAIEGWHFIIFDIKNAYLTAPIEEEVYIKPPEGVNIPGLTAMQVLRLLRALYGTKQAARAFFVAILFLAKKRCCAS